MAAMGMQTAQTPLHAAALLGHTEIIRELLARGFSHEAHDRQVMSASLFIAAHPHCQAGLPAGLAGSLDSNGSRRDFKGCRVQSPFYA